MSTIKVDTITDEAGTGAPTLSHGVTVAGNLSVDGGTIKLDGNYPVGTNNVALGDAALSSAESGANYNIAIGSAAGDAITTGDSNVGIGLNALGATTTASENIAIGLNAMLANTTGASNVGIGTYALNANTTASNNTAVGYQAGYSISTSANNTIMGYQAGYSQATGSGANALFGIYAGNGATSTYNTMIGPYAGYLITSGGKNTIIGGYNGNQGGLDIRTSSNNIVLSDGDGNPRLWINSAGSVWAQGVYNRTTGSGSNVVVDSTGGLLRSTSSLRYKNTVNDATHGLTELLTLRPVTYKGNNDGDTVFGGLIAEEVHAAGLEEFVMYNDDNEPDALAYGNMVSLCIKAIQDQQATITALEARITALENA